MTPADSPARFFIASGCPIATTTLYRCVHLQEQLKSLGHEARVEDWFDEATIEIEDALQDDVIVLYRLPMGPALKQLVARARELSKPLIFDSDDLVFEPEMVAWHRAVKKLSPADQVQHLDGVRRYLETLVACDAVTVATPPLAELARKRGKRSFVHRNSLGSEMQTLADELYEKRKRRNAGDKVVIGYGSGTATHDVDFEEVAAALVDVLERNVIAELWIAGPLALPAELKCFGPRVQCYPLTDWQGWFQRMAEMDIVIAPLEMNNIFCRAKSEIKFVEAGALGLPVVASQIDPFCDAITAGQDGFLAANKDEWRRALELLVQGPRLRAQVGDAARQTVLRNYSVEARSEDLRRLLEALRP